ncbi:MAG: hypothetical protein ACSLE9_03925 [Burkholderiaceae bacterium]
MNAEQNIVDLGLPRDEAAILEGADGSFACLVFSIPAELLARIELVAGADAFKCESHQALVLNHLLDLGTSTKEAELAAQAGQEELF